MEKTCPKCDRSLGVVRTEMWIELSIQISDLEDQICPLADEANLQLVCKLDLVWFKVLPPNIPSYRSKETVDVIIVVALQEKTFESPIVS